MKNLTKKSLTLLPLACILSAGLFIANTLPASANVWGNTQGAGNGGNTIHSVSADGGELDIPTHSSFADGGTFSGSSSDDAPAVEEEKSSASGGVLATPTAEDDEDTFISKEDTENFDGSSPVSGEVFDDAPAVPGVNRVGDAPSVIIKDEGIVSENPPSIIKDRTLVSENPPVIEEPAHVDPATLEIRSYRPAEGFKTIVAHCPQSVFLADAFPSPDCSYTRADGFLKVVPTHDEWVTYSAFCPADLGWESPLSPRCAKRINTSLTGGE